jgi:hypothetical protein
MREDQEHERNEGDLLPANPVARKNALRSLRVTAIAAEPGPVIEDKD